MPGVRAGMLPSGGAGTVSGCWWNEDRVAGALSQCPCWAHGLAGVWLAQWGSCPMGT